LAASAVVVLGLPLGAHAAAASSTELEMSAVPGAPWIHSASGTASTTASNGLLHLQSTRGNDFSLLNDSSSRWADTVDNEFGWTVTSRLRVAPSQAACRRGTYIYAADGVVELTLGISSTAVCMTDPFAAERVSVPVDATAFHVYTINMKQQRLQVLIDGATVIDRTVAATDAPPVLRFGIHGGTEDVNDADDWDFFNYATTAGCTVVGTAGSDTLVGTSANDVVCGLGGNDVIDGKQGNDTIYGGRGEDSLRGASGDDQLVGGDGADILIGNGGNDRLEGRAGDDSFRSDSAADGADEIVGGIGFDTARYSDRTAPVRVTLDDRSDDGVAGYEHDNVRSDVERVIGGSGNDDLVGSSKTQTVLFGGAGDDRLDVRDGDGYADDRIDGGTGTDTCLADPAVQTTSCP
jgi:hypothetical protein